MKTPTSTQSEKQLLVPLPLRFDNKFVRELPGDQQADNYRRQVTGACYSRVQPTQVSDPKLVAYSRETAALLDLSQEACATPSFTEVFAGNRLLPGMEPFAMCYGGHQFGNWAGQLGDGRAINLGEVINDQGERWIIQLKGAGPTPYSRGADGLAVLRSSIREFLCSEAMHHLGVPTSRALSVICSGELVERDMFYDGHPQDEPGAIVCRVAPSFLRFGNYEILSLRGETTLLKQLVDYTIRTDFPHLGEPSTAVYLEWFREICRSTAAMIVHWMRVGFVHGVMNTDNMSILGLTIDYGPYGWLEGYDANWTPNTTDSQGRRYSFGNQPHIGQWNLLQLANAIYPLANQAEPFKEALAMYNELFFKEWNQMMAAKLGFSTFIAKTDEPIITELLDILQLVETDMTIFFRQLASIPTSGDHTGPPETLLPFRDAWYQPEAITEDYQRRIDNWLDTYITRLHQDNLPDEERRTRMNRVNPKYVLRNYLAQLAIDKAENGDFSMVDELLDLVRRPYDEQPEREHFFCKRPEWARNRAGCSMLSCSS
ncbi:MAG: YdiU family protein [Proteobacteria bacterium]|nr:YdiU family protein [Desulfocapsa sp.]MBU3943780.1 YdiU family protein [Pseudomonadota bacterium]MCG2744568.1 YdiU family protein [Desulfobacteraceae bacterium]MBU4027302.1 YdiU family protein [Pseudomonadota bacterium]MBU4042928.1 YdiU family protein [Pseudomonadota bacterium]